jgi:hypothetical protein
VGWVSVHADDEQMAEESESVGAPNEIPRGVRPSEASEGGRNTDTSSD